MGQPGQDGIRVVMHPLEGNTLPKENTHLLLITDLVTSLQCEERRRPLQANYEALCFGCILPDTFFYSSNKDIARVSEKLHGKDGENTNELTFELLDRARRHKSESLLSLSIGYISHCVFDMIFHPVIYSLAGNYYDENASKSNQAIYNHRLLETRIDSKLNNRYYLDKILNVNDKLIHEMLEIIAVKYNINNSDLIKAFKKQMFGNKCFRNGITHRIVYQLNRLNIFNLGNILPLFYNHLQIDAMEFHETINYRDILDGQRMQVSLAGLMNSARDETIRRMNAAFDYYNDIIDRAGASQIIRGESLDTGREGYSVSKVLYSNL
jgi:hypothetical protein